mgnify:CR=1 FL=1
MGLFDIFKTETKSMNKKYKKDDAVDLIREKKIAILGFGSQGQVHALNLKDSGINNIVIALRDNSKSISKAESKGFKVMKLSKAAEWADILMMLVPDDIQKEIYAKHIEQYLKVGSIIGFHNKSHDQKKLFTIRADLGEFAVLTELNGDSLRKSFKRGDLKPISYSIDPEVSERPYNIALAYIIALGSSSPDISYIANENNPFDPKRYEDSKDYEVEGTIHIDENPAKDKNPPKGSAGTGTGFFVNKEGYVITNYHVVKLSENNTKIVFRNKEKDAKIIAYDEVLDIALLKVEVKNKNYIKFSNSSPKKAQSILVAGYPYGKEISDDLKITSGIINSLKGIKNNTSMLQIDATVNPGNSGGPIVDKDSGSLVGVATMKLSKDYTKAAFGVESENTNYGIKSSQVKDFLEANNVSVSIKKNKLDITELEESTVFIFS